jgi:hypothetical protein
MAEISSSLKASNDVSLPPRSFCRETIDAIKRRYCAGRCSRKALKILLYGIIVELGLSPA